MNRRSPPPWLFGIAAMPYGAFNGVAAVVLPFVLQRGGLTVERIATIAALVQAPAIGYVLWAPLVDWRFRRRTWIMLLSVGSGLLTAFGLGLTGVGAVRGGAALLVGASALAQPVSSAVGGLVASVMSAHQRDRTAGWTQAGILGSGVVTGACVVALAAYGSMIAAAALAGALVALPSAAAFAIDEPPPPAMSLLPHLRAIGSALALLVRRRNFWLGAALFLSPVGAGALMNLFSGVAPEFHSSAGTVLIVVGVAGTLTACGALLGGYLLDRIDRWKAYPIAGLVTCAVVAGIIVAPSNAITYIVGAGFYALVTGFAYTAYMAIALELVGTDNRASSTLFTLLTAAVNVPVVYMIRLDGLGHARFGLLGMLATDGIANGVVSMLLLFLIARRNG